VRRYRTPAPVAGLEGVDPRAVAMLVSGRSGKPLSADDPCGFDELEFIVGGEADRLWARHRPALIAEARRRGVSPCWGEQYLDEQPRRSEGRGEE
jgi:hypothetical protein